MGSFKVSSRMNTADENEDFKKADRWEKVTTILTWLYSTTFYLSIGLAIVLGIIMLSKGGVLNVG